MSVDVPKVEASKLVSEADSESSEQVRARVIAARNLQTNRLQTRGLHMNSEMTSADVRRFASPDSEGLELLRSAIDTLMLSARAMTRTLKVARTIADLDVSEQILARHIAEAIQYRPRVE